MSQKNRNKLALGGRACHEFAGLSTNDDSSATVHRAQNYTWQCVPVTDSKLRSPLRGMDISAITSFAIFIFPPNVAKFRGTGNEVSCWSLRPLTQDKVVSITAEFLTSRQSPTICQNQTSFCTTTGGIWELSLQDVLPCFPTAGTGSMHFVHTSNYCSLTID